MTTIHHAIELDKKVRCGSTTATQENSHDNPHKVTCKRCLKALDAEAFQIPASTPVEDPASTPVEDPDAGIPDPPKGPVSIGIPQQAGLAAKAKIAASKAKPAKAIKVPAVHLHHDHAGTTLKNGNPAPNNWCKIDGPYTLDPAEVTCKVCLVHLNGPANSPKTADLSARKGKTDSQKAFNSFVARITYMAYMDTMQPVPWRLEFTNSAGVTYHAQGNQPDDTEYGTYCLFQIPPATVDALPNYLMVITKDAIKEMGWVA